MNNDIITILGFFIIFFATSLGSAFVLFFKTTITKKTNALLLGLSSGIMFASSIWSLLLPAIEQSEHYGTFKLFPVSIGFLCGGLFIVLLDKLINLFNIKNKFNNTKKIKNKFILSKPFKMFLAITIHNIPEGLAVGFAFGGAFLINTTEAYLSALGLSIGIAIQNLPEGLAVSLPLKKVTKSNLKAFLLGIISGIVEPISALIGFFLASCLINAQPWFLSFAAGAMIFVVCEDMIPETKIKKSSVGTWGIVFGFIIMMILDVALG